MEGFGKILKSTIWILLLIGPLFYFGYRAMPLLKDAVGYTRKVSAANAARKDERLRALEELTAGDGVGGAGASGDLAVNLEDPNLGLASAPGSASGSASGSGLGDASQPMKTSPSRQEIIITNETYWDPSAEERIARMQIPDKTKRLLIENYHRTGIMPATVTSQREPASVKQ